MDRRDALYWTDDLMLLIGLFGQFFGKWKIFKIKYIDKEQGRAKII